MNPSSLTDAEIEQLQVLLKKLEVGILPLPVFLEFARLIALPVVEVVPLRLHDRGVQVLLLQRPANDPLWPVMFHTPGSVIRAYDNGFEDAITRVLKVELSDVAAGVPVFVKNHFNESQRGKESAQVYWIEVKDEPKVGKFFDAQNLPDNQIPSQTFINDAVEHYKKHKDTTT